MNGWLTFILSCLFALIVGSFSYTTISSGQLDTRFEKRLERIEEKLDRLIERVR